MLTSTEQVGIDQAVTDLASAGVQAARNVVAAALIGGIGSFVTRFGEDGFEPFRQPFDDTHYFFPTRGVGDRRRADGRGACSRRRGVGAAAFGYWGPRSRSSMVAR